MKTVDIPDDAFEKLETYRRSKKVSRAQALETLIAEAWWYEFRHRTRAAADLSAEEADHIALGAVREERRSRRG